MVNPSKARGTAWESRLVPSLQKVFPYCTRSPLQGSADTGDFTNTGIWQIEAKNHKTLDLAGWMDEARVEATRAGPGQIPVVMFPRRNHPIERAYVLVELVDWLTVAERLERPAIPAGSMSPEAFRDELVRLLKWVEAEGG